MKGATRRWPVAVFCNVLDMAGINGHVFIKYTSTFITRQLVKELGADHLHVRDRVEAPKELQTDKMRQCQVSTYCKKNNSWIPCKGCKRPVCGKCTARVESLGSAEPDRPRVSCPYILFLLHGRSKINFKSVIKQLVLITSVPPNPHPTQHTHRQRHIDK